ncbi:ABC transporter substrate-binding protein [Paracoccus thiocyanatus]|uniref:ABC transporter substrate-binding protein n=2 Tax=Paracoccus thiocyanatus TaxID=34006 RepID=A0A3D8PDU8_9RHOB|nr:ABC transporter substrate-binding protein [Paracoccus thiocyanatus]
MLRSSRRQFLATTGGVMLAAPFIMSGRANAAEFNYKFAHNFPLGHPLANRVQEGADRIAEQSDGRINIAVFPSNQLGSDTDTLNQLRSGAVEFFTLSGIILSTLVPVAAINGVGFAFADHSKVWEAMDGAVGASVRAAIAEARLHAFPHMFDNGFRQITTSTKAIETPDDLKGLKIRVPVSPLWTSMFQALGTAPASINWNETYTALQTGVVDAQENPLSTVDVGKLYEVQNYCSLTNHMWDGFWLLSNARSWNALPEDLQQIVERNFSQSAMDERADLAVLNSNLRTGLEEHGLAFNEPDPAPIREVLRSAGFYKEWQAKFGDEAWGALEGVTGQLT